MSNPSCLRPGAGWPRTIFLTTEHLTLPGRVLGRCAPPAATTFKNAGIYAPRSCAAQLQGSGQALAILQQRCLGSVLGLKPGIHTSHFTS